MAKGRRTGGGSRKGIPNKTTQELRDIIEKAISTQERMELLAQLARGILLEDLVKGMPIVYRTPPSDFAIKQLNEYQYGKPKQIVEVGGEGGNPIAHTVEVVIHSAKE